MTKQSEEYIEIVVAKRISKARSLLKFIHDSLERDAGKDYRLPHVTEVAQNAMDTLALAHKDFYKLLNKHREEN
jgi:hypothetical protein